MSRTYRKDKFSNKKKQDRDMRNRKMSRGCLNHGDCDWCYSNRTHKNVRRKPIEEYDDAN